MLRVRKGLGGRGVERYGLPTLPFYFHAVYLSIRKQFIPEQLLTETIRSYGIRLLVCLKKDILKSKKGNCVFRRPSSFTRAATIV